jgi:hypothetical protein
MDFVILRRRLYSIDTHIFHLDGTNIVLVVHQCSKVLEDMENKLIVFCPYYCILWKQITLVSW